MNDITKNKKRKKDYKIILSKILLQVIMTVIALLIILPLFTVVNFSFKTKRELALDSPLKFPQKLNWKNYSNAFIRMNVGTAMFNTFAYTAVSVFLLVILSGVASWAIARNHGVFFKFSYFYFLIGILIPFQALFLPIYVIGYSLHLTNTVYGIVLMYVATGLPFSVFIMSGFMSQVPVQLEEAARIDGCSVYRTFFSVVMPLLQPAIATLVIMQSFLIWNDYLMASLFVSDTKLKTINVFFQQMFSTTASDYTIAMAGIVIATVPIITLFIVMQRYFIRGIQAGALKG